jgi:hypothetical protein
VTWLAPVVAQGVYFTAPTALLGGTPGQLLVGLRVVDVDSGRTPSLGQAALRWFVLAGPGVFARVVIRTLWKRQAEIAKERLNVIAADSSMTERSAEPDPVLMSRGAKTAAASAAIMLVLVIYERTVGRGARDRLTNTTVVRASVPIR